MNTELQLKLQAHLDRELTGRDEQEVKALLAADAEARALLEELQMVRTVLAGNEPEVRVPESREFYWSKIQREIERQEKASTVRPAARFAWWQRLLVPVSGLALAVVLLLLFQGGRTPELAMTEVQSASPEMGTMTYSDQSAGVTMIWVYDRSQGPFTDAIAADTIAPR